MPASNVGNKGDVLTKASDRSGDWIWSPVTSDHGELLGLLDDDHPQYYNEDRLEEWFSSKDTDDITEGDTNLFNRFPEGGTTGQFIVKVDNTDFNAAWQNVDTDDIPEGSTNLYNRIPPGGATGEALTKIDGTDYNVQWSAVSGGGLNNVVEDLTPELGGILVTLNQRPAIVGALAPTTGTLYLADSDSENSTVTIGQATIDIESQVISIGNGATHQLELDDFSNFVRLTWGGDVIIDYSAPTLTLGDGTVEIDGSTLIELITPNVSGATATNGQFLKLVDAATGEVEFDDVAAGDMSASVYDPQGIADDAFDRANHTGTQTASTISDFDTEVSNNTDVAANTAARHDAVTVTDSAEIDFTLTGQDITASLIAGSIDEAKLDTSVNASLDLADSSTQPGDNISTLTNDSGFITDVVDDTTPQLGGTLDANGFGIEGSELTIKVDDAPSNETASGLIIDGVGGPAGGLDFGDVCYLSSNGKFYEDRATFSPENPAFAMAIESIAQDATGKFLLMGVAVSSTKFSSFSVGDVLYLNDGTSGDFTATAPTGSGDIVQRLGMCIAANTVYFNPSLDEIELA